MPKQKTNKIFAIALVSVFAFSLHFYPVQADDDYPTENEEGEDYLDIYVDTVWRKNDPPIEKRVTVYPGATLTIEKGAEVKFGKINEMGDDAYLSIWGGRLVAEGTQDEPIKITSASDSDYYLLEFRRESWDGIPEAQPSFLRYVEMSNAGYENEPPCEDCNAFWKKIIPAAYADIIDEGIPAVYFEGGRAHMENCTFRDNEYADIGMDYWENPDNPRNDYLKIVNSNFEKNGEALAVKTDIRCQFSGETCQKRLFLKNNWYGDPNGPSDTDGKKIEGVHYLDGWKGNDLIADPVIVIPGIMGSIKVSDELVFDPIYQTYSNLVASFAENGYEEGKNFFKFPYEWRNNNETTAMHLQSLVEGVVNSTGVSKVDIVAHSMGGLVARTYIEEIAGTQYRDKIDQLITLGTPHKGSPKAYLKWEAGEGFEDVFDKIGKEMFKVEAHHAGYSDLGKYIREKVTSVGELLPDYNYLYDISKNEMREYFENYPRNMFLEDLNNEFGIEKLESVNFINIVGNIEDEENTVSKFRVVDSDKWEHGMPENYYDDSTDQGIEYGAGDKTVPFFSASGISADEEIEINSTHSDLPTQAQCKVITELTGTPENECDYVSTFERIVDILTFGVFSPVDIQVIETKTGKWAGKNIKGLNPNDQIEGAYYTGFETENEFLTVPNPENGEYQIVTEGTGEGEYRIEAAKITEGASGKTTESTVEITGEAQTNQTEELTIEVQEDKIILEEEETPVDINSIIQNVQSYFQSKMITKTEKQFLDIHLKNIQNSFKVLEKLKENKKMSPQAKRIVVRILERGINFQIEYLIQRLENQKAPLKKLNEKVRAELVDDLKKIKLKG